MVTLRKVAQAAQRATQASLTRNETIRDAHKAGFTIVVIARASGLSTARVHQIIHNR